MNIEKAISWGISKVGKFKYSMYGSRTGKDNTADCSGFVYECLIKGGAKVLNYVPNTDSLHSFLLNNGFKLSYQSKEFPMKRGDVIIWGEKGASGGSVGHVGIAISNQNWIECTAYMGLGVTIQNYDFRHIQNNPKHWYVYRLNNITKPSKWINEKGTFRPHTPIVLRSQANTKGKILATIQSNNNIKYDRYMIDKNGYVWIRQPREKGYAYMATGQSKNGKRINYWGKFF